MAMAMMVQVCESGTEEVYCVGWVPRATSALEVVLVVVPVTSGVSHGVQLRC
jgi:hypothetical protein